MSLLVKLSCLARIFSPQEGSRTADLRYIRPSKSAIKSSHPSRFRVANVCAFSRVSPAGSFKRFLTLILPVPANRGSPLVARAPSYLALPPWKGGKLNMSECRTLVEPSSAWPTSRQISQLLRTALSLSLLTFYPPGTLPPSSSYNTQNYCP